MLSDAELDAIRQRVADWHEHTGRHIKAAPSAMETWSDDVHFDRQRLLAHLDALSAERDAERELADELAAIVSQSLGGTVIFDEYHPAASAALARHRAARD